MAQKGGPDPLDPPPPGSATGLSVALLPHTPTTKPATNSWDSGQLVSLDHYLGRVAACRLLENVRVRRAGYAFRQEYEPFLYRYKMLSPLTWPAWRGISSEGVAEIFEHHQVEQQEYAFGRTKIFIRNPQMVGVIK